MSNNHVFNWEDLKISFACIWLACIHAVQGLVVRRVDNFIQWINLYPEDNIGLFLS